jgi:hypothetical protein
LTPIPMVYWPPYPWYIDPPTHGILTRLSMVFYPLPMVFWSPTHGIISTTLPVVYRPPYPWYIDIPTHGILTPLPMIYQPISYVLWTLSLLVEMRGGSIYHEGVQNTMTKNWPRGQNTIWKIEPRVKIS